MNIEGPKSFPLRESYDFSAENKLESEASKIREMEIEWDRSYTSSVRRGYMIRLFEKNNLLEKFIKLHWPFGSSTPGQGKRRSNLRLADDYDLFLSGNVVSEETENNIDDTRSLEFALEAHLRDFLAKNLGHIEIGLKLYQLDGKSGIEFPVRNGRIDILAVDSSGKYVVIELKLSQGRNKALGQLLYYMGWVDGNLVGDGHCRGIIIANEISEELAIAASRVTDVVLYRYKMNFSVEKAYGGSTSSFFNTNLCDIAA